MEIFAKKLLISFNAIVLVFTSCIAYNHAEELPNFPFSDTPRSSDTTESPRDPWNSGYMPLVTPDFIHEFSSSQAQKPPSKVEDPVFKPVGLGLNGWGRIPRVPKLDGWGRIPRVPKLNGWGRIPRVPKLSHQGSHHLRLPPIRPQSVEPKKVWSTHVPSPPIRAPLTVQQLAVDPLFEAPSPTPTAEWSPFKAPTSVTEPPTPQSS
ncbi:hypothetical protein POM88_030281 [Heracleum sosnowskyi]|uniref:Uncharacterized protein n=1 Tax=Heracleum sosnowskyi TaxID=360622 RepID=A0AAD8MJ87_9APIA|nr:hypothetical protein POM88_030281 [Heracleum sosnowskyi]